ncbi:helix-turn-helix transcriptional regulator [Sulfitobacter albidus]|uniref:Helix-turn-helix transcriptional regulator n=1 Tax=Sulfitobacter albidus TaxID=2829501 RepID=A0A975JBK5_9RHOB|nr:AraC family transcriptional regulator [Sulfitobacter albidus]QUJ75250.1 helix-turn-helix transcriptional regulator [Sulfitobacter albidus]
MSIIAMPPGDVDVMFQTSKRMLNVGLRGMRDDCAFSLDGVARTPSTLHPNGVDLLAAGVDFSFFGHSLDWELLIEFNTDDIEQFAREHLDGLDLSARDLVSGTDPQAATLARLAIAHLKEPVVDRLYLEGLTTAITARALAFAARDKRAPSTGGTDARIQRAIDYIHAHLVDGMSISEIAGVACMSPSWFSRAFKAQTGTSVHKYVLGCRLERAQIALLTTNEPIGAIAHGFGFADHAHFSRLFKRRYGITPKEMRG